MKIACENCSHSAVCKLRGTFKNAAEKLSKFDSPKPFELELSCPHYSIDMSNVYQSLAQLSYNSTRAELNSNVAYATYDY